MYRDVPDARLRCNRTAQNESFRSASWPNATIEIVLGGSGDLLKMSRLIRKWAFVHFFVKHLDTVAWEVWGGIRESPKHPESLGQDSGNYSHS